MDYSAKGCFPGVGGNSEIQILEDRDGKFEPKTIRIGDLRVGMRTSRKSCVKWIIQFNNLDATLCNGLTQNCAVRINSYRGPVWYLAQHLAENDFKEMIEKTKGPIIGLVLDSDEISVKINNHEVAVLGVRIPLYRPYFDTDAFKQSLKRLCESGVIQIDAAKFRLPEGLS